MENKEYVGELNFDGQTCYFYWDVRVKRVILKINNVNIEKSELGEEKYSAIINACLEWLRKTFKEMKFTK